MLTSRKRRHLEERNHPSQSPNTPLFRYQKERHIFYQARKMHLSLQSPLAIRPSSCSAVDSLAEPRDRRDGHHGVPHGLLPPGTRFNTLNESALSSKIHLRLFDISSSEFRLTLQNSPRLYCTESRPCRASRPSSPSPCWRTTPSSCTPPSTPTGTSTPASSTSTTPHSSPR